MEIQQLLSKIQKVPDNLLKKYRSNIYKAKTAEFKDGRIYIQDSELSLKQGERYNYLIGQTKNVLAIVRDPNGAKKVSKRTVNGQIIRPVVDINNKTAEQFLQGSANVIIAFCPEGVLVIKTIIPGEEAKTRPALNQPVAMHICAGAGVSAQASHLAGFNDKYLIEYNPHDGQNQADRFSSELAKNYPQATIYNIPYEDFTWDIINEPVDLCMATFPCNQFSIANQNKENIENSIHTAQLPLHLIFQLASVPYKKWPKCFFFENVTEFGKTIGRSLEYFFQDKGYFTTSAILDGADYGSRMHRKRWYMVANLFNKYVFPEPTGVLTTPLASEWWFKKYEHLINWCNPSNSKSIARLVNREKSKGSAVIGIKAINPYKEAVSYTITKEYRISVPQGQLKHPTEPDTYAVFPPEMMPYLFELPENFSLGDSKTKIYEACGQSVDLHLIKIILKDIFQYLQPNQLALF